MAVRNNSLLNISDRQKQTNRQFEGKQKKSFIQKITNKKNAAKVRKNIVRPNQFNQFVNQRFLSTQNYTENKNIYI